MVKLSCGMKPLLFAICTLFLALPSHGADFVTPAPKPKLKLAADGFPSGHSTPEGTACDLARAFIANDAALFTTTCVPAYGNDTVRDEYKAFLHGVVESFLKTRSLKLDPAPDNPKTVVKVFAARHLSREGPVTYGRVAFDFQDVMFVDVDAQLNNGEHAVNRTLVVKAKDGQWYVHPAPQLSTLLSEGLDDEGPSTQDFSAVYDLER